MGAGGEGGFCRAGPGRPDSRQRTSTDPSTINHQPPSNMVYESDFYTSRRPYSRPNITSYSVTLVPHYGGIVRASPVSVGHSHLPYIAHSSPRLTPHVVAVPSTATPRSVLWAELDRISHRPRPHLSYDPKEDFLNDHSIVNFTDEARNIRTHANALLRRINTPVLRSPRPLPISLALTYNRPELAVPERITSDDYINRMLEPTRNVNYDVNVLSYYPDVPSRVNFGKGHLACVTYAGGRGYPRRRHLYSDDNRNIRDEILFRSYYKALDNPGQASEGTKDEVVAS